MMKEQTAPPEVHPDPDTIPVQASRVVTGLSKVITTVQEVTVTGTVKSSCPFCPVFHAGWRVATVSQVAAEDCPTAMAAAMRTTETVNILTARCRKMKC